MRVCCARTPCSQEQARLYAAGKGISRGPTPAAAAYDRMRGVLRQMPAQEWLRDQVGVDWHATFVCMLTATTDALFVLLSQTILPKRVGMLVF